MPGCEKGVAEARAWGAQLNVTTRSAAATLGATDDLGAFAGVYTLRALVGPAEEQAAPQELVIKEVTGAHAQVLTWASGI